MFVLYVARELTMFEGTFAIDALLDYSKLISLPVYLGLRGAASRSYSSASDSLITISVLTVKFLLFPLELKFNYLRRFALFSEFYFIKSISERPTSKLGRTTELSWLCSSFESSITL